MNIELLNQLDELEAILRKFKYWQVQSPDLSQVTDPFGVNQISIFQWLQFIYIPRLEHLITAGLEIPHSEVLPYAKQVFSSQDGAKELHHCIAKLDALTTRENLRRESI